MYFIVVRNIVGLKSGDSSNAGEMGDSLAGNSFLAGRVGLRPGAGVGGR
jgi:hypothetical protein